MSNVIAFLESLGRDAALAPSTEGFADAVCNAGLGDDARAALLAGDARALNDLLGGRPTMVCALFPADDDQKQDDEQKEGEDDSEKKESATPRSLH